MRTIIASLFGLALGLAVGAALGECGDAILPILGPGHALLRAASLTPPTNVGMAAPTRRASVYSNAAAYGLFGFAIGFGYPTRRRSMAGRVVLAIAAGTLAGMALLSALFLLVAALGPESGVLVKLCGLGIFLAAPAVGVSIVRRAAARVGRTTLG